MSSEILDLINQRDHYLSVFRKSKQKAYYDMFIIFRNQVKYNKMKAKASYYENAVNENKNDSSKLWKILKNMGLPNKSQNKTQNIGLKIGDEVNFDKAKVADHFNEYFTSIASKLVEKLPKCDKYDQSQTDTFYQKMNICSLEKITEEQLNIILINMSTDKATGLDNLPARFIKDGASEILTILTYLVNLSITSGVVPTVLKSARVVPLHKNKNKTSTGNYRPISILSVI